MRQMDNSHCLRRRLFHAHPRVKETIASTEIRIIVHCNNACDSIQCAGRSRASEKHGFQYLCDVRPVRVLGEL